MKSQPSNKLWHHKWTPTFWWDFHGDKIIVESDHPDFPVIAVYPKPDISVHITIDRARRLIEDLDAGRKDFRKLAKRIPERVVVELYGEDWREPHMKDW